MKFAKGVQQVFTQEAAFQSQTQAAGFWAAGGPVVATQEVAFSGAAGQEQPARIYFGGHAQSPTFLYIHGGGWVGGSIELHDRSAREIAGSGACNVISISYRLAPEHPFPAGLNDCRAALDWIGGQGRAWGVNPDLVFIGGASAGANLAMAVALQTPDIVRGLVLFYGVFGCDFETESYRKYDQGPGLTRARMRELFGLYDPLEQAATNPLITPLLAQNLAQLPPCFITGAEHDVLLDDNINMARALEQAGVPVDFSIVAGVTHGFINRGRLVPTATTAAQSAGKFIADLANEGTT